MNQITYISSSATDKALDKFLDQKLVGILAGTIGMKMKLIANLKFFTRLCRNFLEPKWRCLLSITVFLMNIVSSPLFASDLSWPGTDWEKSTATQEGFNQSRFDDFLKHAFGDLGVLSTDAIVVIRNGRLVYEGYANAYKPTDVHALWSLGKPISNALVGVAERNHFLNIDKLAKEYYAPLSRFLNFNITINDLLFMTSGFPWIEEDTKHFMKSSPIKMFYSKTSHRNMMEFVSNSSPVYTPGFKFNYSSADALLLMAVLRGAMSEELYQEFPWQYLFEPLSFGPVTIERDQDHNLLTAFWTYARPTDIARIGLLFLRDGVWKSDRILPENWVRRSTTISPAQLAAPPSSNDSNNQNGQAFGAQFWLNKKLPGIDQLPYPELPEDAFLSYGGRGQLLLIVPSKELIMVRMATDNDTNMSRRFAYKKGLLKKLILALEK